MLLIYFNSLVLMIGFELNVSISSLKKIAEERKVIAPVERDIRPMDGNGDTG